VRLVLDTNVVVSALLWGGTPERLIALAGDGAIQLVTSPALLAELERLLGRPKLTTQLQRQGLNPRDVLARYVELAQAIDAPLIEEAQLRDPDDAVVLACARAAQVDAIVSGDADLQVLGAYDGIPILSPAQALQRVSV